MKTMCVVLGVVKVLSNIELFVLQN